MLLLPPQSLILLRGVRYTPARSKCQPGLRQPPRTRSSACSRSGPGRPTTSPSSCDAHCTSSGPCGEQPLRRDEATRRHGSRGGTEGVERRPKRTVVSITDRGREALREWLATSPAPARVESKGPAATAVRKLRHQGRPARDDPGNRRDDAQRTIDHYAQLLTEYARGDGLFPDRIHVNALLGSLSIEQAAPPSAGRDGHVAPSKRGRRPSTPTSNGPSRRMLHAAREPARRLAQPLPALASLPRFARACCSLPESTPKRPVRPDRVRTMNSAPGRARGGGPPMHGNGERISRSVAWHGSEHTPDPKQVLIPGLLESAPSQT